MSKHHKKKRPLPNWMFKEQQRQEQQRQKKMRQEVDALNKSYGRDGAYMEIQAAELARVFGEDAPLPEMMVIKNHRFDLSTGKQISDLKDVFSSVVSSDEVAGMDDEQKSYYIFRKVFEAGVRQLKQELQKA